MTFQSVEFDERLNSIENLLRELNTRLSQFQPEPRRIPVSIDQVSELTNLAKPTLYGLVSARKIPFSKKGKKLYFFEDEIIDWIRQGKRKTLAEIDAEADAHLERLRARKS